MNKFQKFVSYIKNPEIYSTIIGIVVSIVIYIISVVYEENTLTLGSILIVLAGLSISFLISDYNDIKTRSALDRLEKLLTNRTTALTDRTELDKNESFLSFLGHGKDILIVGSSLLGIVGPNRKFIKDLIDRGLHIRFLLMDPNGQYIDTAARYFGVTSDSLRNEIKATLIYLSNMAESINSNNGGGIEYRFLNSVIGASILVRDGCSRYGEIRYEINLYQTDITERPMIVLQESDGKFYNTFYNSTEKLWSEASKDVQ